jgi:tetratricopeptide (TPR) repeat protein
MPAGACILVDGEEADRTLPGDLASGASPTLGRVSSEDALMSTIAAASAVRVVENLGLTDELLTEEHPGRYRLEGELGEGGIGRVYIAYDRHLGRRVALKELLEEAVESIKSAGPAASSRSPIELRFVNEARITGQLEHPGIVPVYELGRRADRTVYYAMRLIKGRTMEEAMAEGDLRRRLELLPNFVDLCQTVAYAHSRGVIHRDLKPENVMLGDFGETVILDWGLAKVRGEADVQKGALALEIERFRESSSLKTLAGVPLGTPGYMSPEQAQGQLSQVDERSDVYSLGVILYQLLTGTLPFDGKGVKEVIRRLVEEEAMYPAELEPDCPPELCAIAVRAMQKSQAARYPNAQALAADVRAFLTGGLVGAHRYSFGARAARLLVKNKWRIAAVVVVAIVGSLAWWYRGVDENRREAIDNERQRGAAVTSIDAVFEDVSRGNLQERWLDVFTFKLMALRNPVTESAVVDRLIEALAHPSPDVRRLAARSLSAVKGPTAIRALTGRLGKDVEGSPDVQIEVINALGIIGDPSAEDAVREARVRAGQFGYIWNQTELAYRMIPLPELPDDGASLSARDWNERGNALLWKDRREAALAAFSRAIAADPDNSKPYNNRAIALRQLGELEAALRDYNQVLALNPNDTLALNNRSLLKREMEDYPGALADIEKVVKDGSLGVGALRNRSIIKRFMGDFEGALGDLRLALADAPNDARTYSAMAGTWIWTRDWEQALGALDQAVSLNDKYNYAISQRAMVYWVLGRRDEALVDIERVLALDPADNLARRMRAHLLMKAGQHETAKRDLDYCLENQCIDDQARRALRYAQRAVVYYAALFAYGEALADLDKAVAAQPRSVDAFLYELAAVLIATRAGTEQEASRRLDALLEHHRKGTLWHNKVARILSGDEDFGEAEKRTIRPLERCTVAVAGGLASERSGDRATAARRYASAAEMGSPHELPCILADLSAAALAK